MIYLGPDSPRATGPAAATDTAAPPADAAEKGVPGMIYLGPDSPPAPSEAPRSKPTTLPPASSLPATSPAKESGASKLP
jgi:hypothetical protein